MNNENIVPNARNTYFAFRSMGYENKDAVADLIDNSIDAQAKNVWVTVNDDLNSIFIADDGSGMDENTLVKALTIGGKKDHDTESELGKYGFGLIAGSLSMGKKITIITKNNGKYRTAVFDYDKVCEEDVFHADFYDSTATQINSFDYRTEHAESGTVLIIDDCDKIQYKNADKFRDALKDSIEIVFRKYLSLGFNIFINGDAIKPADPLFLEHSGTERLVDEDVEISLPDGKKGLIHVLAVEIEDQGERLNRQLGLGIPKQGFYVLRNNREIASALEFPTIFKKHNDYNRFKIELSFSSDLDDCMGINLKKHDVAPSEEVLNVLNNRLCDVVKKVRANAKEVQKSKIKKNPFKKEIKFDTGSAVTSATATEPVKPITPVSVVQTKIEPAKPLECTFSIYAGEEDGALFKASVQDGTAQIRYNMKNKLYVKNILEGADGIGMKKILNATIVSTVKAAEKTLDASKIEEFLNALAEGISPEE
ncbi:ATP-binding protein [Candidatus Saccharibacteria bacterium]|nr:ATP-binding protein [Candidatus Saccharibacteria bacterium]